MIDSVLLMNTTGKVSSASWEYDRNFTRYLIASIPEVYVYNSSDRLMHNKFIVLMRDNNPEAVITGSFNLTMNASRNHENIVYIPDAAVAKSYADEFFQLCSHAHVKKLEHA